jgi:hypothetical protein
MPPASQGSDRDPPVSEIGVHLGGPEGGLGDLCYIRNGAPSVLRARVAKLADAKDLKSFGPKGPCGFDPHPGHHHCKRLACFFWSCPWASGWASVPKSVPKFSMCRCILSAARSRSRSLTML